jgi:homoserine O-succinyltransferase
VTETQLLRLPKHAAQIEIALLSMASHESANHEPRESRCVLPHIRQREGSKIRRSHHHGAPVENIAIRAGRLLGRDDAHHGLEPTHVFSTMHICWGSQPRSSPLRIDKHQLDAKAFGIFDHRSSTPRINSGGFDETFPRRTVGHDDSSRGHTENPRARNSRRVGRGRSFPDREQDGRAIYVFRSRRI